MDITEQGMEDSTRGKTGFSMSIRESFPPFRIDVEFVGRYYSLGLAGTAKKGSNWPDEFV